MPKCNKQNEARNWQERKGRKVNTYGDIYSRPVPWALAPKDNPNPPVSLYPFTPILAHTLPSLTWASATAPLTVSTCPVMD